MNCRVRIILSEIEVEADSVEEAEEIATDVYEGDARTRLDYGLAIEGIEIMEAE